MSAIEQYRNNRLEKSIIIRPSLKFFLILFFGTGLLIWGSTLLIFGSSAEIVNLSDQLVGWLGVVFFSFGFFVGLYALLQSRKKGLIQISDKGLYLAHYATTFYWKDIGPAWVYTTSKVETVHLSIKNNDSYTQQMSRIGRFINRIADSFNKSKDGGLVDLGMVILAVKAGTDPRQPLVDLRRLREEVIASGDTVLISIPAFFHYGTPAGELVQIINSEVAKESGFC